MQATKQKPRPEWYAAFDIGVGEVMYFGPALYQNIYAMAYRRNKAGNGQYVVRSVAHGIRYEIRRIK
jgi:hypothetical protein